MNINKHTSVKYLVLRRTCKSGISECMMSLMGSAYHRSDTVRALHLDIYSIPYITMSPWGNKATPERYEAPDHGDPSESFEPTEHTSLLPDNGGYLSPDDPAVG